MSIADLLDAYAARIRELRRADAAVPETGLAPAFQQLLEGIAGLVLAGHGLTFTPEYRNPGVGRPDLALVKPGAPPRAFVELKGPAKPADPARWQGHDKRQFERFSELACWASCNFSEIRLFERGEEVMSAAILPAQALRPDKPDQAAKKLIADHDFGPLEQLVTRLCQGAGQEPAARDAKHLAGLMAHSARLVRGIVAERLAELREANVERHALLTVRQEFRDVLYAHPEAGGYAAADFDTLFSAAFAQTLAFGLLLVREARDEPVEANAWEHMPEQHPLMRTALRVLSQPEVVADIGIGFEVMRDTVNSFAPAILAVQADGRDPILYFYEDFLEIFDPAARERHGVYYTPLEVVRFMSGALDRALKTDLRTQGLADPAVTILDPATGTGTFLLGLAERVWAQTQGGAGMKALALHNLAGRMHGLELLVGPYAVAHYRLHHALSRPPGPGEPPRPALQLPRLGVYLADTLAEPGAAAPAGPLGFVSEGIAEERREADRIKAREPILAIIGNPPYRRLEEGENRTLVGDWMDGLWDDLKEPVRAAGQGNQLNTFPEFSVAFWRWAMWKLFEAENAPQKGVIAFIANRKFLTGWPYAGLRQMMRKRFDRIEIIDLRGDVRRGERAGVARDQGVFNIMVGTAIVIAVAKGEKKADEAATVTYLDAWAQGRFLRKAKLEWLMGGAEAGSLPDAVSVARGELADFRPEPFQNGEWVSLKECFGFFRSGVQTKRDAFVYAPVRGQLERRIIEFGSMNADHAQAAFAGNPARPWKSAQNLPYDPANIRHVSYRPFDRRWLYNANAYIDRPRPELQSVWGAANVGLYAMPGGTGEGPAVWCHGLLPDYHAFRGSYGGYAFPLQDHRPEVNAPNIRSELLAGLAAAYGAPVSADEAFDAMLCLLSASSYTRRFAEDLEDVFPHVPFPADHAIFLEAARIGAQIRAIETFAGSVPEAVLARGLASIADMPKAALAPSDYADGGFTLCADGTGRVENLPAEVWEFAVSGYRVLPRWLEARRGLAADHALVAEFRDICGRIAALVELFAEADIVLEATLARSLSRAALALGGAAQGVEAESVEAEGLEAGKDE